MVAPLEKACVPGPFGNPGAAGWSRTDSGSLKTRVQVSASHESREVGGRRHGPVRRQVLIIAGNVRGAAGDPGKTVTFSLAQ